MYRLYDLWLRFKTWATRPRSPPLFDFLTSVPAWGLLVLYLMLFGDAWFFVDRLSAPYGFPVFLLGRLVVLFVFVSVRYGFVLLANRWPEDTKES